MPSAVVRLICPNLRCKSILAVPGEARGKTVRCRGCGTRVRIPLTGKPAAPATAAETAEEETTQ